MKKLAFLATILVLLSGCSGDTKPSSAPSTATAASSTTASDARTEGTCPVTVANRAVPPNATDWGPDDSHGNGKLWTLFWPYGVVVADSDYVEEDGSIGIKWPWWRSVRGRLTITGRRLDKPAPPLRADINDAYGASGFQPSGIYFSTEGCWEVTGVVGKTELTFVALVMKASTYGLELATR